MFGGIYFGQYWPESAVVAGGGGPSGADPGGAKRKRKHRPEDEIWPQPWQYPEHQPKSPALPEPVPVESLSPAAEPPQRPIAVVLPQVSRDLVQVFAPAPPTVIRITDPGIAARAAEMRRRLRRELEEEEILMLMGFFD